MIATKFQRLHPCFRVQATRIDYWEEVNRSRGWQGGILCRNANGLNNTSRNRHLYQHFVEMKCDSRRTWSPVKGHTNGEPAANAEYCNTIPTFSINKIRNIRPVIAVALSGQRVEPLSSGVRCRHLLSELVPVNVEDVQRMPPKSSTLDFAPTSLLMACSCVFAWIIANLANMTFRRGLFPSRIRTHGSHHYWNNTHASKRVADPSSCRPSSNLNTIS